MFKHKKASSTASEVSSSSHPETSVSDSRRRQSKRDDAIRRKIENDLSKKRRGTNKTVKHRKGAPGTVLSLKPSTPVLCKPNTTVLEASQLMTAKRENCILVVNEQGDLMGIFTAKDLAFRIVGSDLNAATVTIDQIMTPNPMCTNSNDPASDALNLMVEKNFRHLPVLDDHNQIVGVLDITKSYAQQMEKLERMHESSKKLYEALDTVHSEMGVMQQPMQIYQYFEKLKNKMSGPTLSSVLDDSTLPIYCSIKTTVYEATVLMKENKTTAVLVKDNEDKVNGIFTSKDVVLRVIAAGLDPKKCSIVRVMTPQPDVAKDDLSVQEALRKMFDGHYLNLPIVSKQNDIVGIVDVLKLTYATLNQIQDINDNDSTDSKGEGSGPAWNKFWTSLDNDSDSVHSDSLINSDRPETPNYLAVANDLSTSELNIDIKPSDSISHVDTPRKATKLENQLETQFTFKFRSPGIETRVHRVSIKPIEGLKKLRSLINEKMHAKDFEILRVTKIEEDDDTVIGDKYAISYIDDEGDIVSITSDDDLIDCVKINLKLLNDKADLFLHNPHEPAPIDKKLIRKSQKNHDLIPLLPNEILIPGAIMILATATIIGFTFARK